MTEKNQKGLKDQDAHYCEDSHVAKHKEHAKELIRAHWKYMEKVLTTGADLNRTFTFAEVMAMREWDYTSAALHFYGHGIEDAGKKTKMISFAEIVKSQIDFSLKTFGPPKRNPEFILKHIEKELSEIRDAPADLAEWIDIIILAIDGAWRQGYSEDVIEATLIGKIEVNSKRNWPDWRTVPPDQPIEHIRSITSPASISLDHTETRLTALMKEYADLLSKAGRPVDAAYWHEKMKILSISRKQATESKIDQAA